MKTPQDIAKSLNCLSDVYMSIGKQEMARSFQTQAVEIEKTLKR